MTEAEWLACTDPQKMLEFLGRKPSDRKFRLVACAFCRRIWHMLKHADCRSAVETSEQFADRKATLKELTKALTKAARTSDDDAWRRGLKAYKAEEAITAVCNAVARPGQRESQKAVFAAEAAADAVEDTTAERLAQASLIRDIFGNPFRPVTISPAWQTANLVALAQAIYDERAFDRMPILSDALEDAGCTNADVLNHCRQPGEHVRGCWVVDMVLGKK